VTRPARARSERWLNRIRLALPVIALAVLAYVVVRVAPSLAVAASSWEGSLIAAASLYLIGHGVRILRLAFLIGGWRVGFREVASLHLMTSAVSLAVPLKLGELYRVAELSSLTGGAVRAIVIVWCERAFDAVVLLVMLAVAITQIPGAVTEVGAIAAFVTAFVVATAIMLYIVPDNLRRLGVFIIRRYRSPASVSALKAIETMRQASREVPDLLQSKVASLATLTALIWLCEVGTFALAAPALSGSLALAFDGLLAFLAAVTRGMTLLSALTGTGPEAAAPAMTRLVTAQFPLVILGALGAISYLRYRVRP